MERNSTVVPPPLILQELRRKVTATTLTNTSATTVFSVDAREAAILDAINIANRSAGAVTITVAWFDGTNSFTIYPGKSLAAGERLAITDLPLPLRAGQQIRVTGAANVDVIVVAKVTVGNLA